MRHVALVESLLLFIPNSIYVQLILEDQLTINIIARNIGDKNIWRILICKSLLYNTKLVANGLKIKFGGI